MVRDKLRVLCLHSFRTSADIFIEQMRRSGLDKKLENIIDFVYINAPHEASGPPPADVSPFFDAPYYQWWDARVVEKSGDTELAGVLQTISSVEKVLEEQGPFDGFWAFSQGTMVATIFFLLQRVGRVKKEAIVPHFAVMFGGFIRSKAFASSPHVADSYRQGKIDVPSIHFIGDRDPAKKFSHDLADHYLDPIVITHPRGHNIPALDDTKFQELSEFLSKVSRNSRSRLSSTSADSRL